MSEIVVVVLEGSGDASRDFFGVLVVGLEGLGWLREGEGIRVSQNNIHIFYEPVLL